MEARVNGYDDAIMLLQVVMDRRYVSFMYSYPNLIPLSAEAVERIAAAMRRHRCERIYGAFNGRTGCASGVLDFLSATSRAE